MAMIATHLKASRRMSFSIQSRLTLVRNQRALLSSKLETSPRPSSSPMRSEPASLLSDARITADRDYNRWLQLIPSCAAGTALGTYFAVPGVLGPHISRGIGVVVSSSTDFTIASIVPLAAMMSLTAGGLAAALANYSASLGTRRVALAGSLLFPIGIYILPAMAVSSNSIAAYSAATVVIGGVGFYCIYPQIPPHLSVRWFPDRKGLAVSIYFSFFGSGVIVASKIMQACSRAPIYGVQLLNAAFPALAGSACSLSTST